MLTLAEFAHIDEDVYIDFSGLYYSYPFSMLAIGSGIRQFVSIRKRNGLNTFVKGIDGRNVHSYLAHIGFFDYIFYQSVKKMGQARGSATYIPIKKLNKYALLAQISPPYILLRHVILQESKKLASIILNNNNENEESHKILSYCIREIIRNVFEHSRCDDCFIFGQRWYDGTVEISIVDEGIGIEQSLNERYSINSSREAINLALEPGVSRVSSIDNIQDNIHDNSGFGLYILKRIGDEYGWFVIGSKEFQVSLQNGNVSEDETSFNGTYVGLNLNRIPHNFSKKLEEIIYEGEYEAHLMGRNRTASASSREFF